ncbi:MAG: hypothetical protein II625_09510 [Bacilli bacterium]|nr:hypothetical protein [Bacilli bacterium]
MNKEINFEPKHKRIKSVSEKTSKIIDKIAPVFIITALAADLAVGSYFAIEGFDQSLQNGDFIPKDDKAIVMEVDGETVALPLYSYKKNLQGDLIIVDTEGNRYTVPKDSESTLVLGEDALNRANELVNEKELEKGGMSL